VKKELNVHQAMNMLELGRSQFFEWVKRYNEGCRDFTIAYTRETQNHKIDSELETHILKELEIEKALINLGPQESEILSPVLILK
jgi:transposase